MGRNKRMGLIRHYRRRPRHCERSEAIQGGLLDCFASCFATVPPRNDEACHRHCERSEAIQGGRHGNMHKPHRAQCNMLRHPMRLRGTKREAGLLDCFASCLATVPPRNDEACHRHCERSEAIQGGGMALCTNHIAPSTTCFVILCDCEVRSSKAIHVGKTGLLRTSQ
jgi:hypothetical protein